MTIVSLASKGSYGQRVGPVFRSLRRSISEVFLALEFLPDSIFIALTTVEILVDAIQVRFGEDTHLTEVGSVRQTVPFGFSRAISRWTGD